MADYSLKKSLGQHFLKDESISKKIVAVLEERPFQQLVEVGPGGAALTKYLIKIPGIQFKAVELDDEKVQWLSIKYPELAGKIIHQSFLDIEKPFEGRFTVIGNFPYNISTQILFKTLEWRTDVETVIGMFQKEVAERIASKHGSKVYGVISVLMQAFFTVEYLFEVGENAFNPPPKVKSACNKANTAGTNSGNENGEKFFLLVKTAFNQRRKTLRNAVRGLFTPEVLQDEIFNKRAEQLSVDDFARLTFIMN
jgi:16S rRNA (adenine1518-N6/adenine1519-N6)-dimethyltransferase